jgi:hypothetical protein
MFSKTKIALIAALAVGIASPAFAQSFNKGDGTANVLTFAYGQNGTKPAWTVAPENQQIAARQVNTERFAARQTGRHVASIRGNGLYDYAAVPSFSSQGAGVNSPAETGGGSTGYNQMLLNY